MSTQFETYIILKYGSLVSAYNKYQIMKIFEKFRVKDEYKDLREYFKKHGRPKKA